LLSSLLFAVVACRGGRTTPTSPSPIPGEAYNLSFRILHSASGDLGFGFTRTVTGSGLVSIRILDLGVGGVDPLRAVAVELAPPGRIGAFVTSTRTGTLDFRNPGRDATYGILLMSTLNGTDYGCLDYCPTCYGTKPYRYATMRIAGEGEDVHGYRARAASDMPFRYAAELFSAAMSVPGLQLGRVDLVSAQTADITAAWADIPASGYGYRDAPVINFRYGDPSSQQCTPSCIPGISPYEQNLRYAAYLAIHELAHTYLSAPDYDQRPGCATNGSTNLTCKLIACPPPDATYPVLSPSGVDAIRYWALMNHRPST
jgi:hypothetical protein